MELSPPLEELLRKRSESRIRLASLPGEISKIEREATEYGDALEKQASWWSKLLGNWTDDALRAQWQHAAKLRRELEQLKSEERRISNAITDKKKAKERFLAAAVSRQTAEAHKKSQIAEYEQFCDSAIANQVGEFDRQNFYIQSKDYRRGNVIDNYFRNIEDVVLKAFQHCCIFCGTSLGLTFDHFGLTKNEGGNFVLITSDKSSIRLNIVVLCRSCNAAKAQSRYVLFFSEEQRTRALSYQQELLRILLSDDNFLRIIKKWGLEMALGASSSGS